MIDPAELVATLASLPTVCEKHQVSFNAAEVNDCHSCSFVQVKVVIVDSVAFLLRSIPDGKTRAAFVKEISSLLRKLVATMRVALVVVNQMTTKFAAAGSDDKAAMIPALGGCAAMVTRPPSVTHILWPSGESWSHVCHNRVVVSQRMDGTRACNLTKSASREPAIVEFRIGQQGLIPSDTTGAEGPHVIRRRIGE